MMGWTRHLRDDRLYECYLVERGGEAVDPRAADHLADCQSCAGRYRQLSEFLATIGDEAAREADDLFTPERLQQQQDAIQRKLDVAARPARVISFPGQTAPTHTQPTTRVATRWLAAAAAAGLIVGVGVGETFRPSGAGEPAVSRATAQATTPRTAPAALRVSAPAPAPDANDDDRFLRELEMALQRPQTRELLSFDNLTPHAREIGRRVR